MQVLIDSPSLLYDWPMQEMIDSVSAHSLRPLVLRAADTYTWGHWAVVHNWAMITLWWSSGQYLNAEGEQKYLREN